MGFIASLRHRVASAISDALSPPIPVLFADLPPELPGEGEASHQQHAAGFRFSLFRDYQGAPWAWTVEDCTDGKLVSFHSVDAGGNRAEAIRQVRAWLTGARPHVDPPAKAA